MTVLGAELDGQVAVITGAGRPDGLGAAMGRLFAERGATVILTDVLDELGERTAAEIEHAEYLHLDVSSEGEWDAVVSQVVARHGGVDILINNAGIVRSALLTNATIDDWTQTIAVNQTGVFLGMRAGARAMIEAAEGGSIVNVSSIAGIGALPGSTAYGASKWAVRGMTKIAAKELGRHGIRVNSIHPGWTSTAMLADVVNGDDQGGGIAGATPLGRLGTPADIARAALYLVSDAADFVTGQELVVDGATLELIAKTTFSPMIL